MTWAELPDCVLCEVFRYLMLPDRRRASLVCRTWNDCFHSPYIWSHCDLTFSLPQHERLVELVKNHGSSFRTLVLQVDQGVAENREAACRALMELARLPRRRLERLRVRFIGSNPIMYNGQEFVECFYALCGPPPSSSSDLVSHDYSQLSDNDDDGDENDSNVEAHNGLIEESENNKVHSTDDNTVRDQGAAEHPSPAAGAAANADITQGQGHVAGADVLDNARVVAAGIGAGDGITVEVKPNLGTLEKTITPSVNTLKHVDFSGLPLNLDGQLISLLAENNPNLESLDIQNSVYVSKVYPPHIMKVVTHCRRLKSLRLYSCSLSEEILLKFTDVDRQPLEHLSIYHRREQKLMKEISSSCWAQVVSRLPGLRVTLGFDSTCPLYKVSEVMKPEIPVNILRLETYTDLWNEILIAANYYRHTLEKLIVNSPPTRGSAELDLALLELSHCCSGLKSLHVFCVLERGTVEQILDMFPYMQQRGSYTLKHVEEPHPWKPGKDYWP